METLCWWSHWLIWLKDEPIEARKVRVTHWKSCNLDNLLGVCVQTCGCALHQWSSQNYDNTTVSPDHHKINPLGAQTCALQIKCNKQTLLLHHTGRCHPQIGWMLLILFFSCFWKMIHLSGYSSDWQFVAMLVALHFTAVSQSLGGSEFQY